jgi:tRNA nucleotidyltransferase (CCA-adding enzyme)
MLRAARLMARLEFELEDRTAELLDDALDLLDRVSGERIMNELELIFKERHPERALQRLDELGILTAIHPGLVVDKWLIKQLETLCDDLSQTAWCQTTPSPVHYMGLMAFSLAKDELDALLERLNLRVHQRTVLHQVYAIKRDAVNIAGADSASALYHMLEDSSDDARLIAWLALDDETTRQQIVRFQTQLRDVAPRIDGNYLKQEFGLQPGPIFKTIIDRLRDAGLDGQVTTLAQERALVEQIMADAPALP